MVLPAADSLNTKIGLYAVDATVKEIWFNPAKVTSNAAVPAAADLTTNAYPITKRGNSITQYPGSMGTASFYPGVGIFADKLDSVQMVDSGVLLNIAQSRKSAIDAFNNAANSYNGLKTTYEKALDDETARKADVFKAAFEPPIAVPTRPCPPSKVSDYTGPVLAAAEILAATGALTVPTADGTTVTDFKNKAFLKETSTAELGQSLQSGWVSSGKADNSVHTGFSKVFGRLGQTNDTTVKPFQYTKDADRKSPLTMISIYPSVVSFTTLAASQKIEITVSEVDFASAADFAVPTAPNAPAAPKTAGAQALFAGAVATLAVAASLY